MDRSTALQLTAEEMEERELHCSPSPIVDCVWLGYVYDGCAISSRRDRAFEARASAAHQTDPRRRRGSHHPAAVIDDLCRDREGVRMPQ
jgi:hypothetical protein